MSKAPRSRLLRPVVDADVLNRLIQCTSVEELTSAVGQVSARLGFEHWIYGALVPVTATRAEQYILNGYPSDWRQHYLDQGYQEIDPTVSYVRSHVVPRLWDQLTAGQVQEHPQVRNGKLMFNEARSFGLAKGLSVPLHGLGCVFGMMSFAASDPRHPILESTVYAEASLLATYVHQAASGLRSDEAKTVEVLTRRELECLKWAAEGKSSWEIGQLLKITERTAVFHLQNVCRKLRVATRQQAITKGMILGLLDPA